MGRKRSYPSQREGLADRPLYSAGLTKLAKLQEEGKEAYGDAVLEKEHRLGRPSLFFVGNPPASEGVRQVSYVQPAKVIPSGGEIADVLNEMTRDLVIPEEEFKMVDEARQLGWSWQRIANELQGRTAKQLMKIYSDPRPRSRMRYDAPHPITASARLPPERQAVLSSSLAELLGKKPTLEQSTGSGFARLSSMPLRTVQKEETLVNRRTVDRSGGDARVTLHKEVYSPPYALTVAMAHPTIDPSAIKFFEELHVIDADDTNRTFTFSLKDPDHCACFNIGEGKDGSPLLSWSNLFAFYQLPDGSKWAEHGYLYDREDLEGFAEKHNKTFMHLIPNDLAPQELIRRKGRFHSRVQNIEYECWIYKDNLPADHPHEDDDYFYRITFDPVTMEKIEDTI